MLTATAFTVSTVQQHWLTVSHLRRRKLLFPLWLWLKFCTLAAPAPQASAQCSLERSNSKLEDYDIWVLTGVRCANEARAFVQPQQAIIQLPTCQ
ncbi:hypothetical protein VTL71DRAFT_13233 [Oculimacula yallundae]|uniref:Secreted protein n=1 Tax=Oculimacula yallundae TaxID=86028 RepID=A0ABR4CJR9_9HELO